MAAEPATEGLTWMLDSLVRRVEHVRQAVILSRDGLTMGVSRGLARGDAEHLSALAAGVQSLARSAGRTLRAGDVRQTIIEMESAMLFVTAAGKGTCLAVLSGADADVGLIAYEMAMTVKRLGRHLAASPRPRDHDLAAG